MGLLCSLAMLGLASSEGVEPSEPLIALCEEAAILPLWLVYLGFAALFLATAGFASLGAFQVWLFFSLSALQSSRSSARLFGLGFAVVAAVLLFRRGWFSRKPAAKAALAASTAAPVASDAASA